MRRKKKKADVTTIASPPVTQLVITKDGVVRVDESETDDVREGRRLAMRLSRSLRAEVAGKFSPQTRRQLEARRGVTTWSDYRHTLDRCTPRYERTRPLEFGIGNCVAVAPGRKEPKGGC